MNIMNTTGKLFLIDAMAMIYRAFFALNKNPRINSKGLNTSAILGFANTMYDIIKTEKPTHFGVAFDTMAPTFRHIDFEDYTDKTSYAKSGKSKSFVKKIKKLTSKYYKEF